MAEHNHDMNLAWKYLTQTNVSVFLTGKAGTGKTTFLRRLRELSPKRMVVLAPTGVAAINANGQTIHSFFQLPFGPIVPGGAGKGERRSHYKMSKDKKNLIRTLDLLVIDEISMVRCDLLDAVDAELRKYRDRHSPFGGVQLLLIGDLQQLSPVARDEEWNLLKPYYDTPYFFGSRALQQIHYVTVELQHIYRQEDKRFIDILAKVRTNTIDEQVRTALNARYIPGFIEPEGEDWIRLTTHNRIANDYNENRLAELPGGTMEFKAKVEGNFPESIYPADENLILKRGAQVMFIKNDPSGYHNYYNGKIGVVRGMTEEGLSVWCKEDKRNIIVNPVVWENTKYVIDEQTKDIVEKVDGTFSQYPLRLAWAITVHKSQGLTFDHAVVDINYSFAHGQVYVALSRCRTLEGMVLARPLELRAVITDAAVNQYVDARLEEAKQAEPYLPQMVMRYHDFLLAEMFNFEPLAQDVRHLQRVSEEHLYASYPELCRLLKEVIARVNDELVGVGIRFTAQYRGMMQTSLRTPIDENLQHRLFAATAYFHTKLHELIDPILRKAKVSIKNKQVTALYNNALDSLVLSYKVKVGVMKRLKDEEFSVKSYLESKAKALLDGLQLDNVEAKKEVTKPKKKEETLTSDTLEASQPKKKASKGDTYLKTLELISSGMSAEDVAKERKLAVTTIESHIAHLVGQGKLRLADYVSDDHRRRIVVAIDSVSGAYGLSMVKELLPDDYTYLEIKCVDEVIKSSEK